MMQLQTWCQEREREMASLNIPETSESEVKGRANERKNKLDFREFKRDYTAKSEF